MSKRKRCSPEYKREIVELVQAIEGDLPSDRLRGRRQFEHADPLCDAIPSCRFALGIVC